MNASTVCEMVGRVPAVASVDTTPVPSHYASVAEIDYYTPETPAGARGKTTATLAAAVMFLFVGGVTLIVAVLLIVLAVRNAPGPIPNKAFGIFGAYCGLFGAGIGAVGVGLLLPRRWAWPWAVTIAWHWTFFGALNTFALLLILLRGWKPFLKILRQQTPFEWVVQGVANIGLAVLFPAVLVMLVAPRDVGAAINRRDLIPRWTDAVPLRRLMLITSQVLTALILLLLSLDPLNAGLMTSNAGVGALISLILLIETTATVYVMIGWPVGSMLSFFISVIWVAAAAVGYGLLIISVPAMDPLSDLHCGLILIALIFAIRARLAWLQEGDWPKPLPPESAIRDVVEVSPLGRRP